MSTETSGDLPIGAASIYRKMVAVYEDVRYIQKDKRNNFHNYTYASEAAIKEALHEAFAKHGLAMLPPNIEDIHDGEKDAKGQFLTTVKIRFAIADRDSGESVSGVIYGRGVDNSDKGIYKALTGGLKYWLTTTFLIPTGDDPEEEPKGSKAEQKAVAEKKIAEMQSQGAKLPRPAMQPSAPKAAPEQSLVPQLEASIKEAKSSTAPPPQEKPKSDFEKMLDAIHELKVEFESLNARDRYYFVLGQNGIEKSNQIRKVDMGREVYKQLLAELKQVRDRTPIDSQLGVSAADMPLLT